MTSAPVSPAPSIKRPRDRSRHFDIAHLRKDLRSRSVRGGAVTVGSQGVKFVLTMGSTAVLARLLTPDDFGLIAMVAAVVGFATLFKDLGLSMATVQRETITHHQVSTLFWINVAVSALLALLVAAASPLVALLYGDDRLIPVTIALGATFVFGGLTSQHTALLRRQMRFTSLATIEVVAFALAVLVAITIAYLYRTYWALVAMTAVQAFFTMLLAWMLSGWLPGRARKDSGVRDMLAFGGNATGANALNYIGTNLDNVLIGSLAGPAVLGFYSRAYNLLTLPLRQLSAPLGGVAIPALSRLNNEPTRYRAAFVESSTLLLCVTAPGVIFLIVYASDVILLLLGPQWNRAATLFAILGFAGVLLPIWNATGWLWVSQGRMREHLYFHCLDFVAKVSSILIGLIWGAEGVAWGVATRYYVMAPILFAMLARSGPIRQRDIYGVLAWPAVLAISVAAATLLTRVLVPAESPAIRIVIGGAVATGVWVLLNSLSPVGRRARDKYFGVVRSIVGREQKTAT